MKVRTPREMGEKVIEFLRSLPAGLGRRGVVLIPREAVAHEIRRQVLAKKEGAGLLAGVTLTTPDAFAAEVCLRENRLLSGGLEQVWPSVLDFLIQENRIGKLEYFSAGHLKEQAGYPQALASTLGDLDRAGLSSNDLSELSRQLPSPVSARIGDLAVLWQAMNRELADSSGSIVTTHQMVNESARILQTKEVRSGPLGPVCAVATGSPERMLGTLLPVLKDSAVIHLEGNLPARLECDFELSLHGGVEDEFEAAATWVERNIVEQGTPLGSIAVLSPGTSLLRPLATRLEQVLGEGSVYLAGGYPALNSGPGALMVLAIDAVLNGLSREPVAEFLAAVSGKLSCSKAVGIVSEFALLGGNPESHSSWRSRLEKNTRERAAVQRALGPLIELAESVAKPEVPGLEIARRILSILYSIQESSGANAAEAEPEPFKSIWKRIDEATTRLSLAGDNLPGVNKLMYFRDAVADIHLKHPSKNRFGDPLVFVGKPEAATGLSFERVRLIGLCEGTVPPAPGEDPVLPDSYREAIRRTLPGDRRHLVMVRSDLAKEKKLQAEACCAAAAKSLSLSAASQQLGGEQREVSTFLLDVASRSRKWKQGADHLPGLDDLNQKFSGPVLARLAEWRSGHPRSFSRQVGMVRTGSGVVIVPDNWLNEDESGFRGVVEKIRGANGNSFGSYDGIVQHHACLRIPGLSTETTIRVRDLDALLQCPLAFARQVLLGLCEPQGFPSRWDVGHRERGSILHDIADAFFKKHGNPFLGADNRNTFRVLLQSILEEFWNHEEKENILDGELIEAHQKSRLLGLVDGLLLAYLETTSDHYVDSEKNVRECLPTPSGELHVSGRIDLITGEGEKLVVHDLKSGKPHPLGSHEEFEIGKDLQPLVYDACLQNMGAAPVVETGLMYVAGGPGQRKRVRRGKRLDEARSWAGAMMATAREVLSTGAFVRTSVRGNCTYCVFHDVCGEEDVAASSRKLNRLFDGPAPVDEVTSALRKLIRIWEPRKKGND